MLEGGRTDIDLRKAIRAATRKARRTEAQQGTRGTMEASPSQDRVVQVYLVGSLVPSACACMVCAHGALGLLYMHRG